MVTTQPASRPIPALLSEFSQGLTHWLAGFYDLSQTDQQMTCFSDSTPAQQALTQTPVSGGGAASLN